MSPLPFKLQYSLNDLHHFMGYETANGLRHAVQRGEIDHVMSGNRPFIPLSVVYDRAGIHGEDRATALVLGMATGEVFPAQPLKVVA